MKKLLLTLLLAGSTAGLSSAAIISMTTGVGEGGADVAGTFTLGVVGTVAATNNWPGGETPNFAVDGVTTTKYLNFAELNTGLIVTPTGPNAALPVNLITFTAANDSPARDPLTYSLYGSSGVIAGGVSIASLTPITTGAATGLATDPGRLLPGPTQSIANSTAYASYLILFPTVRDAPAANSMQIGNITFENIPEPTTGLLGALGLLGLAARRRRA